MHHAGARDGQAGAGASGHIADGLSRIGGGLLVPHAHILDADLLRGGGDGLHRETNDPEHMLHALLLQTARHQLRARNLTHVSTPVFLLD